MQFLDVFNNHPWEAERENIYGMSFREVETALGRKGSRSLDDFKALISPAAAPYLEQMAIQSQAATLKRFGRTIQMYVPLYLSSHCANDCVYCGFKHANPLERKVLSEEEIVREAQSIKALGFDHLLAVTGESAAHAGVDYFEKALDILSKYFSHLSLEVQPLEQEQYERLMSKGLNTVLVYQETYNRRAYERYHTRGNKSRFDYRLATPERLGRAGVYKVGVGALMGLEDWRADSFFTALHLQYLKKSFWKTKFSISFPRLRPAQGAFVPPFTVTDKELAQLICAYRLFDEDVELSLSTRESPRFRDNVIKFGITTVSAGSSTRPGGYADKGQSLEQFAISDDRTPLEVADIIRRQGYEPVWKDWDTVLTPSGCHSGV